MKNNIIVLGKFGQLSRSLQNFKISKPFIFIGSDQLDLRATNEISRKLRIYSPSVIINCAAFNDVDGAERGNEDNQLINFYGIKEVVNFCKESNVKLIHISTDYVFDGEKSSPYTENDLTKPINKYGLAKLQAEVEIIRELKYFFILRTSWLYSHFQTEYNFLNKIISLIKSGSDLYGATDLIGTPTYSNDLARIILEILESNSWDKSGVYHAVNNGSVSRYIFIKEILELTSQHIKNQCYVHKSKANDFKQTALRPVYTGMSNSKLQENFNISINDWDAALKIAINNFFLTN